MKHLRCQRGGLSFIKEKKKQSRQFSVFPFTIHKNALCMSFCPFPVTCQRTKKISKKEP